MRIVFVGSVLFSEHCLREVLRLGGDVVGIVTVAPEHAGSISDYTELGRVVMDRQIPVYYPNRFDEDGGCQ